MSSVAVQRGKKNTRGKSSIFQGDIQHIPTTEIFLLLSLFRSSFEFEERKILVAVIQGLLYESPMNDHKKNVDE